MAGKGKSARKKRAKTKKQLAEKRNQDMKPKRVLADQAKDVVGNGAERVITPEEKSYIEDTRKPEPEKPFDPKSVVADILKKRGA